MNWIPCAIGAACAFALSYLLHTVDVNRLEKQQSSQIAAQQTADKAVCDSDKSITKEANDALQKDRDAIAARLASLQQLPATCIVPQNSTQLSSSKPGGHATTHGISSSWLRSFAAECEGYRRELTTCIQFVNQP